MKRLLLIVLKLVLSAGILVSIGGLNNQLPEIIVLFLGLYSLVSYYVCVFYPEIALVGSLIFFDDIVHANFVGAAVGLVVTVFGPVILLFLIAYLLTSIFGSSIGNFISAIMLCGLAGYFVLGDTNNSINRLNRIN